MLSSSSSLKIRGRKTNGLVVFIMYMIFFGSGLYCGVFVSESYLHILETTGADPLLRNRHLMSTVDNFAPESVATGNGGRTSSAPQFRSNSLPHQPTYSTSTGKAFNITLPPMFSNELLYENLPRTKGGPPGIKELPRVYKSTKSIAGCLFIMDDTIRLLEWLSYHYTVLPLSHLMVAIDPHSKNPDRIMEILDSWSDRIHIKAYRNDTEWLDLPWDYGYSRSVRSKNGKLMKWMREKKSDIYFGQVHKRRQNYFCVHCMRYMKQQGMDWTIITDSDEYLMFNYKHADQEDPSLYDSLKRNFFETDVDNERRRFAPYRQRLPAFETRATIADYIHQEMNLNSKCIMFPGLQFTSYESRPQDVSRNVPEGVNPYHLVTLRHRKAGPREGKFSKTMVDVSSGLLEDYDMESNVNVHVPNKLLCGMNGLSGSGKDYISSVFRLHHYRTGTWESFIEREADRRANMTVDRFMERNIEPKLIDDDIRPWIGWFIEKVGMDEAKRLLIDPLAMAYEKFKDLPVVPNLGDVQESR